MKVEHNSRPRNPLIAKACFMAGYIDTWGRGTLKIINACKEAGLPESEIKEMNGGLEFTIFKKAGVSQGLVDGLVDGLVEIRKEFGPIAELIQKSPQKIEELLKNSYHAVTDYLQNSFGITSEKLRKSFGMTSEKKIARPIQALMLIAVFPEITAEQLGAILGVSARSAETYIQKLKGAKLIDRMGGKKEGVWGILRHS